MRFSFSLGGVAFYDLFEGQRISPVGKLSFKRIA